MNDPKPTGNRFGTFVVVLPMAYALLRWLAQPPMDWGWLSFVVLIPLLMLVEFGQWGGGLREDSQQARGRLRRAFGRCWPYRYVWLAAFGFWLASLQGLRHAHPLMFLPMLALAGYLAVYSAVFVALVRRLRNANLSLMLVAPLAWIACEWVRNYLLTGISVCMLGHSLANFPLLIQVADLGGTYLVSAVIVLVNAGVWLTIRQPVDGERRPLLPIVLTVAALAATLGYGTYRLNQQADIGEKRFALLDLDLQTEYDQPVSRADELFHDYAQASMDVVGESPDRMDVLVWPESMFGGDAAWMVEADGIQVPDGVDLSLPEFRESIAQYRAAFDRRNIDLQSLLRRHDGPPPHVIAGGPVMRYGSRPEIYSALVHIDPERNVEWYGKNHLVMFGEYIPVLSTWSLFRGLLPPGLGLDRGEQPVLFDVDGMQVLANICIETAVERIAVNHMHRLGRSASPDVIVTVTNDCWFDHSSVVEHHLRCAQLLAVGCRRTILSAGNGGPTAWIDSHGRVVQRIPSGGTGKVIAMPGIDQRRSLYVAVGSWPAGLATFVLFAMIWVGQKKERAKLGSARS